MTNIGAEDFKLLANALAFSVAVWVKTNAEGLESDNETRGSSTPPTLPVHGDESSRLGRRELVEARLDDLFNHIFIS